MTGDSLNSISAYENTKGLFFKEFEGKYGLRVFICLFIKVNLYFKDYSGSLYII
jgi:hypothetical protein